MGNAQIQRGRVAPVDPKLYFPNDLPKFINTDIKPSSKGRFMKTYKGKYDGTAVVVKVYVGQTEEDMTWVIQRLSDLWLDLNPSLYPNLAPYQLWQRSKQPRVFSSYLMRQHFMSNLHDRMATRPFLADVEKTFIIYQLIRCLEDCHTVGYIHGDLKPENVMITSWNWIVLTDFSPFKPVMLPADDPSQFNHYYNNSPPRNIKDL